MSIRLSEDAFAEVVWEALVDVPPEFEQYMEELAVDVEDRPDRGTLEELEVENGSVLLGLYRGVPLGRRSVGHMYRMPERIVLYQRNLEEVCRTRAELIDQIRKTTFHEVGHHFGMSEGQLRRLGY